MTKPQYIVSTCGTSIFTSGLQDGALRGALTRHANRPQEKDLQDDNPEEYERIKAHLTASRKRVMQAGPDACRDLSAELNGILSLYEGQLAGHKGDYHQLLCTDTWLGEEAARIVRDWLQSQGLSVGIHRQKDLRTDDLSLFQLALADLVHWCEQEISSQQNTFHVVFNLTGGFKSIQGFMQTLAHFYADETVYIFESDRELLRLPRLPVRMEAEDTVLEHLDAFRRLAAGLPLEEGTERQIPETLLFRIDGQVAGLSPWAEMVWAQSKKAVYRTKIFDPFSPVLRFSPTFDASVTGLEPQQRVEINGCIDALILYLEERRAGKIPTNLKSLDFKELKGNPAPPSTHECDAWHNQDAKRLFGHFEKNDGGEVFVLDRLAKGLGH